LAVEDFPSMWSRSADLFLWEPSAQSFPLIFKRLLVSMYNLGSTIKFREALE
jgi:hypothetical protein